MNAWQTNPKGRLRGDYWFLRHMKSEKRTQKFHSDDAPLPRIWVVLLIGWIKIPTRHDQSDLGSDASSVWNFCARFSDVISRGNQWWRCKSRLFYQASIKNDILWTEIESGFGEFPGIPPPPPGKIKCSSQRGLGITWFFKIFPIYRRLFIVIALWW